MPWRCLCCAERDILNSIGRFMVILARPYVPVLRGGFCKARTFCVRPKCYFPNLYVILCQSATYSHFFCIYKIGSSSPPLSKNRKSLRHHTQKTQNRVFWNFVQQKIVKKWHFERYSFFGPDTLFEYTVYGTIRYGLPLPYHIPKYFAGNMHSVESEGARPH